MGFVRRRRNKGKRGRLMGDVTPAVRVMIEVLCHAAKADGQIDDREVSVIANIIPQLTGTPVSREIVAEMARLADPRLSPSGFKAFGKGLRSEQRELIVQSALMVVSADGQVSPKEQAFISGLVQGLEITRDRFDFLVGALKAA
ncbi:TerB family tellurite resistance protein [Frigidibacter sp. RF13]|uniref:tellurite resistance TerB family protein n=1 Tax=Frigidibacter sp. RF13 TaxID=2997340 RepID=UPI00226D821F|nr:TerB family tellurite resistance protein [Frigidibacter sp. RF13]MCY1125735.1 TerB family tellurite resistance protein [Frigidibacter sp. RF13]